MAIRIRCMNRACGVMFKAPDGAVGEKVRCPGCGMTLSVATGLRAAVREWAGPAPSVAGAAAHASPPDPAGEGPLEDVLEGLAEDCILEGVPGEDALEFRTATVVVFLLGLVGMVVGLAIGLVYWPEQAIAAAYAGAALGWVGGFALGVLLALSAEKASSRVQCPNCQNLVAVGAEKCPKCGSATPASISDPLGSECLRAGRYALDNLSGVFALVGIALAGFLVVTIAVVLLPRWTSQPVWVPKALLGLEALVGFVVFACWADYFLSVAGQAGIGSSLQPKAPSVSSPASFWTAARGFQGLAVLALYVVPLVTLPLLPAALVLVGSSIGIKAMNPWAVLRATLRHGRAIVVVWIFLLMWLACLAVAGAVVAAVCEVGSAIPDLEGPAQIVLRIGLWTLATAGFSAVAAFFGLTMFRCIAAFGRCNPTLARGLAR